MTDITQPSTTTGAPEPWQVQAENHARLAAETRTINRAAIFAALAGAGITTVNLHFDGYSDSGQIEDVAAFAGDQSVVLPSDSIEVAKPAWDGSGMEHFQLPLHQAIESLAFDYLELTHSGWEDGDGAFGDFIFDVAAQSIKLDYDERYTATDNYQHDL